MTNFKSITPFTVLLIASLTACSNGSSSDHGNITWQAQSLSPDLTRIYQTSCKNCHENTSTGAPLTGDLNTWNKVLEKGLDTSIERAVNGYGGMPPGGQCFECNSEHFAQLIRYMSKPSNSQATDTP